MAGLVGIGSQMNRDAINIHGQAAGLERARNQEADMAEAAEKNQEVGMTTSGAATGAMIGAEYGSGGGPWGTLIGGLGGAAVGWLGSQAV